MFLCLHAIRKVCHFLPLRLLLMSSWIIHQTSGSAAHTDFSLQGFVVFILLYLSHPLNNSRENKRSSAADEFCSCSEFHWVNVLSVLSVSLQLLSSNMEPVEGTNGELHERVKHTTVSEQLFLCEESVCCLNYHSNFNRMNRAHPIFWSLSDTLWCFCVCFDVYKTCCVCACVRV